MLRHIVLLQFQNTASTAQQVDILVEFAELKNHIDQVQALEVGENNSPEQLNQNFTHAVLVTFADASARDEYLTHPAHQRFVERLKPLLADVLVLDYEV
ncbi:MAG: Dabb family protein [Formosimonas sp.]